MQLFKSCWLIRPYSLSKVKPLLCIGCFFRKVCLNPREQLSALWGTIFPLNIKQRMWVFCAQRWFLLWAPLIGIPVLLVNDLKCQSRDYTAFNKWSTISTGFFLECDKIVYLAFVFSRDLPLGNMIYKFGGHKVGDSALGLVIFFWFWKPFFRSTKNQESGIRTALENRQLW